MSTTTPQNDAKTVANRTIVQAAVLAVVVLMSIVAWLAFDFILLLFASILFGVLIHGVSRWLCSKTALSYKLSMGGVLRALAARPGGAAAGWSRRASPNRPMRSPIRCPRPWSACVSVPSSCPGRMNCCSSANAWRTRCPTVPARSVW